MADLTYDILTNREQYPDDAEITLQNGQKVTVKAFRDAVMPKADMTKLSEKWAGEKRQLEAAAQGLQQQLADAARARETKTGTPAGTLSEDDYLNDPVLGPITRRLKAAEERVQFHETAYLRHTYEAQLAGFAKADKNFKKDEFLDFAIKRGIADLQIAHDLYTRPSALEDARQAGYADGVKKGKEEASVPRLPTGSRRAPKPAPDAPGFLDLDAAERDPEILQALSGGEPA